MENAIRCALVDEYKSSLSMLKEAIDICPDNLWLENDNVLPPYWQVVYHTLFFTHLYLCQNDSDFVPWNKTKQHLESLDSPAVGNPFTKADLYEYYDFVLSIVDESVNDIDLMRQDSGFSWYPIPKLNHAFVNIRHIMMHVGQLDTRLRQHNIKDIDWKA